jgi:hypothetical protein
MRMLCVAKINNEKTAVKNSKFHQYKKENIFRSHLSSYLKTSTKLRCFIQQKKKERERERTNKKKREERSRREPKLFLHSTADVIMH